MALSENPERLTSRFSPADLSARLRAWLTDHSDRSLVQRMASTAFLIRVASAGLAYFSQAILARWMGSFEFGIFVYVWTWVMVIGGMVDLGLSSSAQRFIPDYAENRALARLRGFLSGSRWIAFMVATVAALLGAAGVKLLDRWLDEYTIIPLYIACLTLPIYGVMHVQDGIARSYNWINIAMLPPYIARQIIVIALMGAAYLLGFATDATTGVAAAAISVWITGLGQMLLLNRSLTKEVGTGVTAYELPRWLAISLPMFIVNGFYLLLLYVDILILKQFVSPDEIGIYYAAAKTMSLVTFVYFAVSATASHKFTEYFVAGDRARLSEFLADSIRWTFWPSLAATTMILICGWPLLWLFGERFVQGYHLMFVLAIGILARAAIGPGERFLNMLGEQKICAAVAAAALALNLLLCVLLIPTFGIMGAAIAMSVAFVVESVLIFAAAKRRLGFHLFVWGRPAVAG